MTIEQSDIVDFVAREKDGNNLTLYISDHLQWDAENEKLLLLQEKLNRYMAFLESGEVYERFPDVKHGNFKIKTIHKYQPSEEGYKFLEIAQRIIGESGVEFEWGPGEEGYENES
jgi:hypothetical protein